MIAKAGRGSEQFMLRLPDGMRDRIREAAEANQRSMNAEILSRLEASFSPPVPLDGIQLTADEEAIMDSIMRNFADLLANRKQREE
jgi:hypothetical protein